jgi:alanine-glyoxylate transaminase/serine-glyoxylate transaminase/serine-pyruvate transaminase
VSPRAIEASKSAKLPKSYWAWDEIIDMNKTGYFPYTPNTNLLYGLHEAIEMLESEGLENVFARHKRWSAGVRSAVEAWGLPVQCADKDLHSPILTGVIVPKEMGLKLAGVNLAGRGVEAAMEYFAAHPSPGAASKAS